MGSALGASVVTTLAVVLGLAGAAKLRQPGSGSGALARMGAARASAAVRGLSVAGLALASLALLAPARTSGFVLAAVRVHPRVVPGGWGRGSASRLVGAVPRAAILAPNHARANRGRRIRPLRCATPLPAVSRYCTCADLAGRLFQRGVHGWVHGVLLPNQPRLEQLPDWHIPRRLVDVH